MSDFFSTPDDTGEIRQSDLQASLGERLGAQALDTLDPQNSLSAAYIFRRMREESAGGRDVGVPGAGGETDVFSSQPLEQRQAASEAFRNAIPDTAIDEAKARVKQEGLDGHLRLPDQPSIKSPVLELMIQEAHERRDREAAIARGPQGFIPGALGLVTSLGAGMIDPVNIAAFSIPVLGEARWGKLMASAGDSLAARAGVRALQGGAQGAVGTAALQPADWWLHTLDGQDYTMAEALKSVVMGAGMGAAFHAGGGAIGDVAAKLRGRPLPGSPEDLLIRGLMSGTHVHADQLAEAGVPAGEIPGIAAPTPPPLHPAEVLADLPPAAQDDLVRATVADVTADRPARAAEVLQIAADHDPRLAESIEVWHGSAHDFERFDLSKLGTGEGAQTYGHGLYFAENEKVALGYKQRLSDKAFVDKVAQLYDEGFGPDDAWHEIKDHWKEFTPAEQRLMTALEKDGWLGFDYPHQAVSAALRDIKAFDVSPETTEAARAMGNMYRVRIKANHEHMLDWDKPLSEQPQAVKDLVKQHDLKFYEPSADRILATDGSQLKERTREPTGEEIYQELQRRRAAEVGSPRDFKGEVAAHVSSMMSDAGIPGIKYLDQGSRDIPAGVEKRGSGFAIVDDQGNLLGKHGVFDNEAEAREYLASLPPRTRNFVVFNDKHIEITGKNGEPVKREQAQPQRETTVTINGKSSKVAYASHGERAAAAAADPRWRQLADAPPAHSTPEAMSESQAGDAVAEPASVTPKAVSAIEQAATEAEEAWRKVEGSYTEQERAMVNDALAKLDTDRKAKEDLITEGAACLAAAEAA